MFGRKKDKKKTEYTLDSENLAIPEVHVDDSRIKPEEKEPKPKETITFDNVAIPEVHIKNHKNRNND